MRQFGWQFLQRGKARLPLAPGGRASKRSGLGLPAALAILLVPAVSGCTSGPQAPVFGAVFGLESAETVPFRSGKIPEPAVGPGDRVLGLAANAPGQCIFLRANGRTRFIAACPEGYDV